MLAGTRHKQFGQVSDPNVRNGSFASILACPRHVRLGVNVDERFAWDEGEGERTREWWLSAHRRFFGRRAAAQGFHMHDEIETMFERFAIVWPPEIADISRSAGDAITK